MDDQDTQARHSQQIERLLGFPQVGALAAAAIESNLAAPAGSLKAVLETLLTQGRIVRTEDGRFTLPAHS